MLLKDIESKEGSLELLKGLLEDKTRKVHGAFYDNSFLSQRYLTRNHVFDDRIDIEDNSIKLTLATRVEIVGLMELENTLDMFVRYSAGDIPSFAAQGEEQNPVLPELVAANRYLFTIDILLNMKDPIVTYQEFSIADIALTLVTLKHIISEEEGLEQEVQLLFGDADKLYLLSHFYGKKLNHEEVELVLDFIVDKNLTGKAIVAVKITTNSAAGAGIFPYDKLISSYKSAYGDYIFGATTGYIKIPEGQIQKYEMQLVPNEQSGSYQIDLFHEDCDDRINIFME